MRKVYILRCADNTLYTGITTDLERRILEHNTSTSGAKYTKARRPVRLAWSQDVSDRSLASKFEYVLKQKTKAEKETIIQTQTTINIK